MNALEIHTRELKQLDANYKQVDTYVDGLNLHADLVAPMKASLKEKILKKMESRSGDLAEQVLSEEHVKINTEIKEAKEAAEAAKKAAEAAAEEVALVTKFLIIIGEINAETPDSIVVAAPPHTSAQLWELIQEHEDKKVP